MAVTEADLREIFHYPSVKEVAFEIRFAPRLRIVPEIWRIQDSLAESYPVVSQEMSPQGIQSYVFANSEKQCYIKASQENFVFVTNQYSNFEEFKAEALVRTEAFAAEFEVQTFQRAGLRYVNHIDLKSGQGLTELRRFVNLPIDFDRFDPGRLEQFLTEFRLKINDTNITIRGALLQVPNSENPMLFVLDLDCYTANISSRDRLSKLLDNFHHEIQIQFLEYIREEFKQRMRGKA